MRCPRCETSNEPEKEYCIECGFHFVPKNGFKITSLHYEDLEGRFTPEEIGKLTNKDMKWIASKMADAYLDGQFWNDLEYFVREVLDEREL